VSHDNGPLLFNVVAEWTANYNLKKIISQEASLRALGEKMQGDWTILGLYGEHQKCLRVARQLLGIPDLELPSVSEGVAGLYSELRRTLILTVIDRDLMSFHTRPYVSKNISTQLISYLLDVASTIIVCPSDEQLQDWYYTTYKALANPYVTRTHSISRRKVPVAPQSIPIIIDEDLSGLVLDGDGMNSAFSVAIHELSSASGKENAKRYKHKFMKFIESNINSLHRQQPGVVQAYNNQLLELWLGLKDTSNRRNLSLYHIKQTLTKNLKKQYSCEIGLLKELFGSDNRVKCMSEELDSVIDRLFESSIEITIERVNIYIQRTSSLNLVKNKQTVFSGILNLPECQACQLLTLSQESMLALFQHEGQTVSLNIKTDLWIRYNIGMPNSINKSLTVVPGSTSETFFAYSNTKKWARSGPLEAHGIEQGYNYDCVFTGETEAIIAGFYLKVKRQLVYINQAGTVFAINFKDTNKTPTKVLDTSGSPLRPSSYAMFLDVRVPDNEQVYVFKTASAFVIYKADFSFFDRITCKASQYKVINDDSFNIYLISFYETLQGWGFSVGGEHLRDQSDAREVVIGNPIVDILQCAIGKFGSLNQNDETRKLLILSGHKTQTDKVLKYTKTLPHCGKLFETIKVPKLIKLQSIKLYRWAFGFPASCIKSASSHCFNPRTELDPFEEWRNSG
jgi:hypothetical protein